MRLPFVPDPEAQQRAHARWLRKERLRSRWRAVGSCLKFYNDHITPAARFRSREGWWVLLAGTLLVGANLGAAIGWCSGLSLLVAGAIAFDLLVVNTTIIFITKKPVAPLRSAIFTFIGYVNLALAFSVAWVLLGPEGDAGDAVDRLLTAFYQSVRTMVTIGPDTALLPNGMKLRLLTTAEALTGIYFLGIVIANYASWAGGPDSTAEDA